MKANRKSHKSTADPEQHRKNIFSLKTRHAEERALYLASLVDNISDALISTDMQFHILEWNPAAESMYGWTAAEVTGRPLQEFMQSEFIDTIQEDVIKVVMENGIWKGEVKQNRKDGARIPVMASVSLVKDGVGKSVGFVAINRDISERKQAEDALRKSEQTFSVIFNKAPFAAGLSSLSDGAYLEVNEAFERVFGFSREEIIGKTSLDLGMYPDPEVRARAAAQFREQGFAHNVDMRLQARTGEIRDLVINSDLVEIGGEKYILTTANDISDRKQAEQKMKQQNQRLNILREIDTAILAADSMERIVGAALSHIRELIECRRAHMSFFDWNTNEALIFSVSMIGETSIPRGTRVPMRPFQDLIQALSKNQSIVIDDLTALPDPPPLFQAIIREGFRSVCVLPLFSQSNLIGTFNMSSEIPGFFDEEKINLGHEVANQVAIATTQNRLVEALREERNRQTNILNGMLAFVGLISLDGILLEINRAALSAVGMKAEEIIGKPVTDLPFWSDSDVTRVRIGEAIRRAALGELVRADFPARLASGQVIMIDILFNPLRDAAGNIVQVIASGVDITERKRTEEALRENETRLQSIIDTEPECVKVLDLNGRLLEMNPAGLAMIEADRLDDVIGQNVANLVIPQHRAAFQDLAHSIAEGKTGTLQFEIEGLKGTRRWLETHAVPLRDNMGNVTAILGITLDITERKRAEQQIQRQIQNLRALHAVDSAITSSFDLDMTLRVLLREVITQLGVDAADVLLFNPSAQILEYAAARGFRSDIIRRSPLHWGEGFAGRAILERRIIHIPNMVEAGGDPVNSLSLAGESFVTYFGAPLIAKGQVVGVLEIFHRTSLNPDREWLDFLEALAKQAAIAIDNSKLFRDLQRSNLELSLTYEETIEGWSRALDLRDKETEGHTLRVTELTLHLARAMNIREAELVHIRHGALLHDIGKMGVPDRILFKPGSLTSQEWEIMRKHPIYAYELLSPIRHLKDAALNIPYCHHEKWDGTGYPRGLKGEQIPLAARIFSVVDVWDAITSNRPYRPAWTKENAMNYIREKSGIYFDSHVVDVFLNLIS